VHEEELCAGGRFKCGKRKKRIYRVRINGIRQPGWTGHDEKLGLGREGKSAKDEDKKKAQG
jgi:hypothetical protein